MIYASVIGNLTKDAETRTTPSGKNALEINVAVNRKNGPGYEDTVTYIRGTMWGERGQKLKPYLLKGGKVCLLGELYTSSYKAKDGSDRVTVELKISDIELLGSKKANGSAPAQKPEAFADYSADEIPF